MIEKIYDWSWRRQKETLREILTRLLNSRKIKLDLKDKDWGNATTGKQMTDRLLAIDIPQPSKKRSQDIEAMVKICEGMMAEIEKDEGIKLDPEQVRAIAHSFVDGAIPVSIVQGPAGTGKTHTLLRLWKAIRKHFSPNAPLFIASQTNPAVDLIVRGMLELHAKSSGAANGYKPVVRVGNNTNDVIAADIIEDTDWENRGTQLQKIKSMQRGYEHTIAGTYNGLPLDRHLRNTSLKSAKYVVCDETSRGTVPELLQLIDFISTIEKLVLFGDHFQLPATGIKDDEIEEIGESLTGELQDKSKEPIIEIRLENVRVGENKTGYRAERKLSQVFHKARLARFKTSLLESVIDMFSTGFLAKSGLDFTFLKNQRRSGSLIVDQENFFYDGKLVSVRAQTETDPVERDGVVICDDYKGRYGDKAIAGRNEHITTNAGEVHRAISWVNWLINNEGMDPSKKRELAVITPYKGQKALMEDTFTAFARLHEALRELEENGGLRQQAEPGHPAISVDEAAGRLNYMYARFRVQQLYGDDKAMADYLRLAALLADELKKQNPDSAYVRELAHSIRGMLKLGERFVKPSEIEKETFEIVTADSSIGSEWKAIVYSWTRSNTIPTVGFMKGAPMSEGWKRRNVMQGRAQSYSINIMDVATLESDTNENIHKWIEHNKKVFEKAKQISPKSRFYYRESDGEITDQGVKPAFIGKYDAIEAEPVKYDEKTNTLSGRLTDLETGKPIDLSKASYVGRAPPEEVKIILDEIFKTNNYAVVKDLITEFRRSFKGNILIIDHPDDPVISFSTPGLIVVSRSIFDNRLALLHEISHAAMDSDPARFSREIDIYLRVSAPEKLHIMLQKAAGFDSPHMYHHYLLRALFWHVFGAEDRDFTRLIKERRAAAVTGSGRFGAPMPLLGFNLSLVNHWWAAAALIVLGLVISYFNGHSTERSFVPRS
ncbi:MAG: AAA domain-containing protein, partial [Candidatus Omnitrophica bacterium]|nr:AAA domain-containing protein [Candidatus Omnitrophota bacterium]